eukprot:6511637-Alexandrium_andersonii.AAC.1
MVLKAPGLCRASLFPLMRRLQRETAGRRQGDWLAMCHCGQGAEPPRRSCLLYTSDAADDM